MHMRTLYSTYAAEDLASLIGAEYDLPSPITVQLMRRGYNDHYRVTDGQGRLHLLRIYLAGRYWTPTNDDIRFEIDLLSHLHRVGVPVSYAAPRKSGARYGLLSAPEGERVYALFTFAPGSPLSEPTPNKLRAMGRVMAQLHVAADRFQSELPRYCLDLSVLVDGPLERSRPYLAQQPEDWALVEQAAAEIRTALSALPRTPGAWGLIHGDLHSGNLHVTEEGQITLFDFDHGGFGWRAYDLAIATLGKEEPLVEALLEGYQSVRPLADWELAALPMLRRARILWDDGDMLAMVLLWGDLWVHRRLENLVKSLRSSQPE